MAVLKRQAFYVVYFSEDATNQEMNAERTAATNKLKAMGFTDPEIKIRGPFKAQLASGTFSTPPAPISDTDMEQITYTDCKVAIAEVRP